MLPRNPTLTWMDPEMVRLIISIWTVYYITELDFLRTWRYGHYLYECYKYISLRICIYRYMYMYVLAFTIIFIWNGKVKSALCKCQKSAYWRKKEKNILLASWKLNKYCVFTRNALHSKFEAKYNTSWKGQPFHTHSDPVFGKGVSIYIKENFDVKILNVKIGERFL